MFCIKCGTQNSDTNTFCIKCGAPLYQPGASGAGAHAAGNAAPRVTPGQAAPAGAAPRPAAPQPGYAAGQQAVPGGYRPAPQAPQVQQPVARPQQAAMPQAPMPQAQQSVPTPRPAQRAVPMQQAPVQPYAAPQQRRQAPSSDELPRIVPDYPRSSSGPQVTLVRSNGTRYRITEFPASVGKGSAANVRISGNTAISRVHVTVNFLGNGFSVEDRRSTNGTRINGNVLQPGEYVRLHNGDRLTLGDEDFIVEI